MRFSPSTTRNIAAAGLSSQGKSAKPRILAASCTIVPHLPPGSGNPRPPNASAPAADAAGAPRRQPAPARGADGRQQRQAQRDPRAEQQAAEHVAAITVGAEEQQGRGGIVRRSHQTSPGQPDDRDGSESILLVP